VFRKQGRRVVLTEAATGVHAFARRILELNDESGSHGAQCAVRRCGWMFWSNATGCCSIGSTAASLTWFLP
jgi:hypothetical protein